MKSLRLNSSKKREEYLPLKTYNSIYDLPQWNWDEIHKKDNLSYIKKTDNYQGIEEENRYYLRSAWNNIYSEYINEFGLSEKYLEILAKKKSIARHKNRYIQTEDRVILNFIRIEEHDLEVLLNDKDSIDFGEMLVILEKRLKREVGVKDITVYQYYNYIRTLSKKSTNG